MKKRAGIFDPWRQAEAPPIDDTPARKTPHEVPLDDTRTYPLHCVQFNGIRAGIYVWLVDQGEEDSSRARKVLVDLVHRVSSRPEVLQIFMGWGVYTGVQKFPNVVVVDDGERKITIVVPAGDDRVVARAIDNLSLALREVSQSFPDVRDMLGALKIRPYLK